MTVNVKFIFSALLALFIVALQVQWTGTFGGTLIRLGTSDLLLPVLLFMVTASSIVKQGVFTVIVQTLKWPLWFLIFTLLFVVSMIVGYYETGLLSTWAIVNKFLGWCLLMGYFFLGNIIARDHYEKIEMMLKVLFTSSALICIVCFIAYFVYRGRFSLFASHWTILDDNGRYTGFFCNANAIALFSTFVVLIQLPYYYRENKIFTYPVLFATIIPNLMLIIVSLPLAELFGRSRTAKIALIVGLTYFVINNLNKYKILNSRLLLLGLIPLFSSFLINGTDCEKLYPSVNASKFGILKNAYMIVNPSNISACNVNDNSVRERIETTQNAIRWWLKKPILGIGLGSFLEKQKNSLNKITLHNTPLWLLTEMGLIGFLLFLWFVVEARKFVLRRIRECSDNILAQGMLLIFPSFLIASLSIEIFYQRYLWFFMGLVLGHKALARVVAVTNSSSAEFKQKLDILSAQIPLFKQASMMRSLNNN